MPKVTVTVSVIGAPAAVVKSVVDGAGVPLGPSSGPEICPAIASNVAGDGRAAPSPAGSRWATA